MTELRNVLDDPAVVGRIAEILQLQWDPAGVVRDALSGSDSVYREQAIRVAGMLAAEARRPTCSAICAKLSKVRSQ